jgi:hypothetical protein
LRTVNCTLETKALWCELLRDGALLSLDLTKGRQVIKKNGREGGGGGGFFLLIQWSLLNMYSSEREGGMWGAPECQWE